MCAHAVRVTIEKLPGVDSAKVSLNEGRVTIVLKPGNTIEMNRIRESVERNGFTPREATVTARAEALAANGGVRLRISGTRETYDVVEATHRDIQQQLRKHAGKPVEIGGVVPVPAGPKAAATIQVTGVKAVER